MPLVPTALAQSLENDWLVPDGGSYPSSVSESGQKFAAAFSSWFSGATAAGFPCSTASARQSQLATAAAGAFSAGSAAAAGAQLAAAVAMYLVGQVFGAGVASAPTATAAAQSTFTGVFSNLDSPNSVRAQQLAAGLHTQVVSTLVVFPPVISPPQPIL
ncbi:hypothetical protein ACLESO_31825 [Pyxidicoccus sp. 3LG]